MPANAACLLTILCYSVSCFFLCRFYLLLFINAFIAECEITTFILEQCVSEINENARWFHIAFTSKLKARVQWLIPQFNEKQWKHQHDSDCLRPTHLRLIVNLFGLWLCCQFVCALNFFVRLWLCFPFVLANFITIKFYFVPVKTKLWSRLWYIYYVYLYVI